MGATSHVRGVSKWARRTLAKSATGAGLRCSPYGATAEEGEVAVDRLSAPHGAQCDARECKIPPQAFKIPPEALKMPSGGFQDAVNGLLEEVEEERGGEPTGECGTGSGTG